MQSTKNKNKFKRKKITPKINHASGWNNFDFSHLVRQQEIFNFHPATRLKDFSDSNHKHSEKHRDSLSRLVAQSLARNCIPIKNESIKRFHFIFILFGLRARKRLSFYRQSSQGHPHLSLSHPNDCLTHSLVCFDDAFFSLCIRRASRIESSEDEEKNPRYKILLKTPKTKIAFYTSSKSSETKTKESQGGYEEVTLMSRLITYGLGHVDSH